MEFCSDMFLLPLGMEPIDSIDLDTDSYIRNPRPNPPPREYISNIVPKSTEFYQNFLNNNIAESPPLPPLRSPKLDPIFESHESEEML